MALKSCDGVLVQWLEVKEQANEYKEEVEVCESAKKEEKMERWQANITADSKGYLTERLSKARLKTW